MPTSRRKLSPMREAPDFLMTETATANLLGLKPGKLRYWRTVGKVGQPPYVRLGRQIRYRASDLAEYIDDLSAGAHL